MTNGSLSQFNHAEILGMFSSIFCFFGAFLPWGTINTVFGSVSVHGLDRDGMVTFILSLLALVFLYYAIIKSKKKLSGIVLFILGFLITLIAIVDGLDITQRSTELDVIHMQVGIGIYLTGIGGFGLIISGIWESTKQEILLTCEKCGKQGNFKQIKECPSDIFEWKGKFVCKSCYEELKKYPKDTW